MLLFIRNFIGVLTVIYWGWSGAKNNLKALNWSYIVLPGSLFFMDVTLGFGTFEGARSFWLWAGVDVWLVFCGVKGLKTLSKDQIKSSSPPLSKEEMIVNMVREYLGESGVQHFLDIHEKYGEVSACWDAHDLDNRWESIVCKAIGVDPPSPS